MVALVGYPRLEGLGEGGASLGGGLILDARVPLVGQEESHQAVGGADRSGFHRTIKKEAQREAQGEGGVNSKSSAQRKGAGRGGKRRVAVTVLGVSHL